MAPVQTVKWLDDSKGCGSIAPDNLPEAVRAERERCTAIAEAWSAESKLRETFSDFTEWELRASAEVARVIAKALRG